MNKIEKKAWSGWRPFREIMDKLWHKYECSGQAIVDGELEKEDEIFRELFLKAENYENFLSMVRNYWEENYHFVANAYNQLIRMFKVINEATEYEMITILPEVEGCNWGSVQGKDEVLTITESFYKSIINRMNKYKTNQIKIISKKDYRLFKVMRRHQMTDDGNYTLLCIIEVDIIRV